MRVAVIGAGVAGLTSAKWVSTQGIECEVFELSDKVGGTWVYTDDVDVDQNGYPIHSAMYQGLRTNLPKEVMGFSDYPFPNPNDTFLTQEKILEFLNKYADDFELRKLIRFNEYVNEVKPYDNKWQIQSTHTVTKVKSTSIFDVVMVCTGHYHTPEIPDIPGQEKFKGLVIHSKDYRRMEKFKNQKVLVIGAGYSGIDVALQVAEVAETVVLSHHPNKREIKGQYPKNITKKPEVKLILNDTDVEFVDGTISSFDSIIFCTGYKFNFPFLHESCGVKVESTHVANLYKHIICIEKPTLCFIGLPFFVCAFPLFDLQAHFYSQYLNKSMTLPSQEEMQRRTNEDMEQRKAKGYSAKFMHMLGHDQNKYYEDVANEGNFSPIPKVFGKIWAQIYEDFFNDNTNFRSAKFSIIDNDNFVKL